ncbi:MAG: glycerol-3-phosphate cytidylyltransferase [Coriobacteriaceae bacterium]|nr:glycerol-3-phosphate cytidylyltransferase [Coriobacteriaceae bacterium]
MSEKKYHVGYTCGVFDLFHVGHLNLLERCKEMCDVLIVGVCDDEYVRVVKHKDPVIPEEDRARILRALKCVDDAQIVDIETTNDKMIALERFKFDVLFSGDDWKGSERYLKTEAQFAELGACIEYLPYTHGISTSGIRQQLSDDEAKA